MTLKGSIPPLIQTTSRLACEPWRVPVSIKEDQTENLNSQGNDNSLPEFLTVKQAAEFLSISPSNIYRLCTTNKLSHYKFGDGRGAIRIKRTDLLDLVERCRVKDTGEIQRPVKSGSYVFKHLNFRPTHRCGAMTARGTACTRMTRNENCSQHQS